MVVQLSYPKWCDPGVNDEWRDSGHPTSSPGRFTATV